MTIAAINEQLLRAIGVGVALIDIESLDLRFYNDTFKEWFGEVEIGSDLRDLFAGLDPEQLQAGLNSDGRYATETTFRLRRRTMTIAMSSGR